MIEFRDAPAILPRGRRIYAIGDIHGAAAKLRALHALIARDLSRRPVASALLLHLGDYVDKGPDSRAVMDELIEQDPVPGLPVLNLSGNHEETMLAALSGDGAAAGEDVFEDRIAHEACLSRVRSRVRDGFETYNI